MSHGLLLGGAALLGLQGMYFMLTTDHALLALKLKQRKCLVFRGTGLRAISDDPPRPTPVGTLKAWLGIE